MHDGTLQKMNLAYRASPTPWMFDAVTNPSLEKIA